MIATSHGDAKVSSDDSPSPHELKYVSVYSVGYQFGAGEPQETQKLTVGLLQKPQEEHGGQASIDLDYFPVEHNPDRGLYDEDGYYLDLSPDPAAKDPVSRRFGSIAHGERSGPREGAMRIPLGSFPDGTHEGTVEIVRSYSRHHVDGELRWSVVVKGGKVTSGNVDLVRSSPKETARLTEKYAIDPKGISAVDSAASIKPPFAVHDYQTEALPPLKSFVKRFVRHFSRGNDDPAEGQFQTAKLDVAVSDATPVDSPYAVGFLKFTAVLTTNERIGALAASNYRLSDQFGDNSDNPNRWLRYTDPETAAKARDGTLQSGKGKELVAWRLIGPFDSDGLHDGQLRVVSRNGLEKHVIVWRAEVKDGKIVDVGAAISPPPGGKRHFVVLTGGETIEEGPLE